MSRLPRKYSDTGIYHIMIRGNAKQDIFIGNQDKRKLLKVIFQKRAEELFIIYAYCIMLNHAHLVVQESNESVSKFMKRITTSYASYFNKKYQRVGHVFQDRFKSQVIKDDSYLLSAIRYVHNNPEKAGISIKEDYPWSSYQEYFSSNHKLTGIEYILRIFSSDPKESVKMFQEFSNQIEKREFLDIDMNEERDIHRHNVYQFIDHFLQENHVKKVDLNNKLYRQKRNELIQKLIEKSNLSKRSIAEITGINRETVRRVSKEPSP